jgi:SAM-dependent methyltransferase
MHPSSASIIAGFVDIYLPQNARVLEVGSWSAPNQSKVRDLFLGVTDYVGLDIAAGPGVDLVATDSYFWIDQCEGLFDVVVSAQVFEHNPFFWLTILNMSLVLKPGGVMLIVAPSAGVVHRYPLDCWRFFPDAGVALAAYARCEVVDTGLLDKSFPMRGASLWRDWYCVLKKPNADPGSNDLMREILIKQRELTEIDFKPVETVGPLTLHLNSIYESKTSM